MNKFVLAAVAAGSALLFTGAAFAQGPGGSGGNFGQMILKADANKDGKVTKAEMIAERTARFTEADKNKDGFITADEMGDRADRMKRQDADGDGKISKAEATNVDRMFGFLDKNGDGVIDAAEAAAPPARPPG